MQYTSTSNPTTFSCAPARQFEEAPTAAFDAEALEKTASGIHLENVVRLRHWAEPMNLPPERLSVHVLEASDKAQAVIEYARANHASLIVIGEANYSEPVLGLGRSVTTAVVEQAACSVYVVKGSSAVLADSAQQ